MESIPAESQNESEILTPLTFLHLLKKMQFAEKPHGSELKCPRRFDR